MDYLPSYLQIIPVSRYTTRSCLNIKINRAGCTTNARTGQSGDRNTSNQHSQKLLLITVKQESCSPLTWGGEQGRNKMSEAHFGLQAILRTKYQLTIKIKQLESITKALAGTDSMKVILD